MATPARLGPSTLRQWCHAFVHGTEAGLPLVKLFRQQAKSGPSSGRKTAGRIADRLHKGDSLADSLAPERAAFPALFVELASVGEESGRLGEAFAVLTAHFEQSIAARRVFLVAIVWPAISLAGAILIVALMLLILGLLAPVGGKAFDPLGLGLVGPTGALIWLFLSCGSVATLVFIVRTVVTSDDLRSQAEAHALTFPGLRGCVQALALSRFATAYAMTTHAGMRADKGISFALRAAANRAYSRFAPDAGKQLRAGRKVAETLGAAPPGLFPDNFLDTVETGETTGRIAEVMEREASHYQQEAARRTKILAGLAGVAVYGMVALLVIVLIFRIAMSIGGMYDDAMKGL